MRYFAFQYQLLCSFSAQWDEGIYVWLSRIKKEVIVIYFKFLF
jgi:hypothetical protein